MKALIALNEAVHTGARVVEIRSEPFDMGLECIWVDCADTCVPNLSYYDVALGEILPIPLVVAAAVTAGGGDVIA